MTTATQWKSWRDAMPDSEGLPPPGSAPPSPRPTPRWLLVLSHCLDLLALLLLGAAAALLRWGRVYLIYPQLHGVGGLCGDAAYKQPRRDPVIEVPPTAVYVLVILAPAVLIPLLQLLLVRTLKRKLVQANCSRSSLPAKTFIYKRIAKVTMVFLVGLCLASIVTDALRLLVSRPRPYFLADDVAGFQRYCRLDLAADSTDFTDGTVGPREIDARLSFPCYRCSMLAFSGALMATHAERALRGVRVGGGYVLRALAALVPALPALLVGAQALESRSNHWQDIVVGLALGVVLAVYVVVVLERDLEDELEAVAAPLRRPRSSPLAQSLPRLRIGFGQPSQQPPPPPQPHGLGQGAAAGHGLGHPHQAPAPAPATPPAVRSVEAFNETYQSDMAQWLNAHSKTDDLY